MHPKLFMSLSARAIDSQTLCGPYFCQSLIAGLNDEDKPFKCSMDSNGANLIYPDMWSRKQKNYLRLFLKRFYHLKRILKGSKAQKHEDPYFLYFHIEWAYGDGVSVIYAQLIKEGAVIYGFPCKPCLLSLRMDHHHHHHPHLPNLRRAYKSILKKCLLNFKSSSKSKLLRPADAASDPSPPSLQDPLPRDTRRSKSFNGVRGFASFNSDPNAPSTFRKHPSFHQGFPLSRNASQRNQANQPSSVSRSMSQKNVQSMSSPASSDWKSASTPIKFSKSSGIIKPPPIEKKLECSLEELCFGSMKKIIITRDILTNNGQTVQEEELLTIKVKPGWRKGTKITFEGMGNERPGSEAADIIFEIAEKKHALFRREGDDLELAVKVPLVKALTGCTISVPLLGGNKLSLTMNEIIWPGHEHTIAGQGMPTAKDHGIRGSLKITFLVEFPIKLSDKQRADIIRILQNSS